MTKRKIKFGMILLLTLIAMFSLISNIGFAAENDKPIPGTLKWKFIPEKGMLYCGVIVPVISKDGTIYAINVMQTGLYALNSDGTLKWQYREGRDSGGLALDQNGTIYFSLSEINPNGTLKLKFLIKDVGYTQDCYAIGKDGTIYFGSDNGNFYAVNSDGSSKWVYKVEPYAKQGNESSPAISKDGTIYFGSDNGNFYAIDSNMNLKWKINLGSAVRYASPAIGKDETVYIVSSGQHPTEGGVKKGRIFAINPVVGTIKWQYTIEEEATIIGSPIIGRDGTIYIGSLWVGSSCHNNGYFYAINPNGTLKWKFKPQGWIQATPTIGEDGVIYITDNIMSNDGYLYALDSITGKELWKYRISSPNTSPVLDKNGTVYVGVYHGFYAINCSSKMMDPQSPWPKFHKDMAATGCFGNGFKYYISDNPVPCEYNVTVNSDEYYRLTWDAKRIRVLENFKAEVNFTVKGEPGVNYRIDYNTALCEIKEYSPTHIGIPLRIATEEEVTCEKWYHYDVNLKNDAMKYFSKDADVVSNINFMRVIGIGNVEIKNLMLYY